MLAHLFRMSKERIYWPFNFDSDVIVSDKAIVHKMKDVCRLKQKDEVYFFNGQGEEACYIVEKISKSALTAVKDKTTAKQARPKKRILLGFPLSKEDRVDFILQKCVELGAAGFIPFISQRSINKVPSVNKVNRWKKIVIEATRQSGRLWLPQIEQTVKFNELIQRPYSLKIAGSIDGKIIKDDVTPACGDTLIVVGPVGDFSPQEYEALAKNDFLFIKLADLILRVETAASFIVGLINYFSMNK